MPAIEKHTPGTVCWVELATSDTQAAKNFYTSLFGWSTHETQIGPDDYYTILRLNGLDAAALFKIRPEAVERGVPPHWLLYFTVENADEKVKEIEANGGRILAAPLDVSTHGRMAVAADPQGAVFAIWQAKDHKGVGVFGEVNALCWSELGTTDKKAADAFYKKIFNLQTYEGAEMPGGYIHLQAGSQPFGGIYEFDERMKGIPPHWQPYFCVQSCEGSVKKAQELGASVVIPPTPIPNTGVFSLLKDAQGAVFSLIELTGR